MKYKISNVDFLRTLIKQQAEALRELFPDTNTVGDIGDTELLKVTEYRYIHYLLKCKKSL